ncbi:hypothetical protein TNCT_318681, partial [Trichonephila clavata]
MYEKCSNYFAIKFFSKYRIK